MLRKLQIIKKATGQKLAEYSFDLVEDASDEDFLEKAWYSAADNGEVIEANKINYQIEFID